MNYLQSLKLKAIPKLSRTDSYLTTTVLPFTTLHQLTLPHFCTLRSAEVGIGRECSSHRSKSFLLLWGNNEALINLNNPLRSIFEISILVQLKPARIFLLTSVGFELRSISGLKQCQGLVILTESKEFHLKKISLSQQNMVIQVQLRLMIKVCGRKFLQLHTYCIFLMVSRSPKGQFSKLQVYYRNVFCILYGYTIFKCLPVCFLCIFIYIDGSY